MRHWPALMGQSARDDTKRAIQSVPISLPSLPSLPSFHSLVPSSPSSRWGPRLTSTLRLGSEIDLARRSIFPIDRRLSYAARLAHAIALDLSRVTASENPFALRTDSDTELKQMLGLIRARTTVFASSRMSNTVLRWRRPACMHTLASTRSSTFPAPRSALATHHNGLVPPSPPLVVLRAKVVSYQDFWDSARSGPHHSTTDQRREMSLTDPSSRLAAHTRSYALYPPQ